ncbi:hypothetical protein CDCA_CDCA12G3501 [Cyanidium caldarium]|uniref:Uncharacterized protein n=1 Tax=Cyanidium caldarium TaxID=2771 RepID=A0AAV9IZK7_CYACA|nr:hypothetical protein CDCA_CDCA12G3501 [Cyanidium caldarium]
MTCAEPWSRFEQWALLALECPLELRHTDKLPLLVAWLESACVRALEPEARQALQRGEAGAAERYLRDTLQCPYGWDEEWRRALDWLLGRALMLAAKDRRAAPDAGAVAPVQVKWEADEMREALEALREALRVPAGTPAQLLRTAEQYLAAWDAAPEGRAEAADSGEEDASSSPPTGLDPDVLRFTLRHVYVMQLRALQREMNSVLAELQRDTAQPHAEGRLGRTGR